MLLILAIVLQLIMSRNATPPPLPDILLYSVILVSAFGREK
jgi:hypothetical protein